MARTADDVAIFLHSLGRAFEKTDAAPGPTTEGEATFLLRAANGTTIAMRVAPPIVAINVSIGPAPQDEKHQLKLYRRLLELNSTDLMHVAYGISAGAGGTSEVVLAAALPLENLDANELDATLSDIDVAVVRHTKELAHFARD